MTIDPISVAMLVIVVAVYVGAIVYAHQTQNKTVPGLYDQLRHIIICSNVILNTWSDEQGATIEVETYGEWNIVFLINEDGWLDGVESVTSPDGKHHENIYVDGIDWSTLTSAVYTRKFQIEAPQP
jgi:hypothetical protein